MKFCILGDGLTGLALAKALVNLGINVDVFKGSKVNNSDKSRTIGISKNNIEFFNKNILNIEKFLWEIKKIEIDNENFLKENLINFEDNNKTPNIEIIIPIISIILLVIKVNDVFASFLISISSESNLPLCII